MGRLRGVMRVSLLPAILMMLAAAVWLGGNMLPRDRGILSFTVSVYDYGWPMCCYVREQNHGRDTGAIDGSNLVINVICGMLVVLTTGVVSEWWLRQQLLTRRQSAAAVVAGVALFSATFNITNKVHYCLSCTVYCYGVPFTNYRNPHEYSFMGIAGNLTFWIVAALLLWRLAVVVVRRARKGRGGKSSRDSEFQGSRENPEG